MCHQSRFSLLFLAIWFVIKIAAESQTYMNNEIDCEANITLFVELGENLDQFSDKSLISIVDQSSNKMILSINKTDLLSQSSYTTAMYQVCGTISINQSKNDCWEFSASLGNFSAALDSFSLHLNDDLITMLDCRYREFGLQSYNYQFCVNSYNNTSLIDFSNGTF